jgi:hypothetical protein
MDFMSANKPPHKKRINCFAKFFTAGGRPKRVLPLSRYLMVGLDLPRPGLTVVVTMGERGADQKRHSGQAMEIVRRTEPSE